MPVIDTSFKQVAIDLMGEMFSVSSREHRYILSVVDYATKYPEAVELKSISTVAVPEALVSIFFRAWIPEKNIIRLENLVHQRRKWVACYY